jgi:hypothetical protein
MSQFALVTCSYAPDYERCRLLVQSVSTFAKTPLIHYLIVDQRDYGLFSTLAGPRTKVLTVESFLPWWLRRVPGVKRGWWSFKTWPVRNWIVQQLGKIAFARQATEPIIVFADSDVTFIRPFSLDAFCQPNGVRLFRVPTYDGDNHQRWCQMAHRLLGVSGYQDKNSCPNYIGNLIVWRQANVVAMCDRIEQISGKSWQETLAATATFSEYFLYGVFVDKVLGETAHHFPDWSPLCHEYWEPEMLTDSQLAEFWAKVQPDNIAVMISAKAGIAPSRYAHYLHQQDPVNGVVHD